MQTVDGRRLRSVLFDDWVAFLVVVKAFHVNSIECHIASQLLGEQPWPKGSRWQGTVRRMWETLHFVPLAAGVDGLVRVTSHPDVAVLVTRRLVSLAKLASFSGGDVLVLTHVVALLPVAQVCLRRQLPVSYMCAGTSALVCCASWGVRVLSGPTRVAQFRGDSWRHQAGQRRRGLHSHLRLATGTSSVDER
jgi:hypothetical protein